MTKSQLVAAIADSAQLSKKDAGAALDAFQQTVIKTLKKGDKVSLPGFATFKVAKRKAGTARNPRTGEVVKVPARTRPRILAGKLLKEAVGKKK